MGLEPTTLRDLVGCSNHWATGDSMVSEGQFVGLDWNRIARLHSQVLVSTCENSLTASRCHIKAYQDAANQPPKWAYKICEDWRLTVISLNMFWVISTSEFLPLSGFEICALFVELVSNN